MGASLHLPGELLADMDKTTLRRGEPGFVGKQWKRNNHDT